LTRISLTESFLDEALPKIETTFDGLILDKELLAIEAKMREKIGKDDPKQQEVLDQIRLQLLMIQARFTKGLEASTAPVVSSGKKGMIKSTAGGLAGAFFLMLLALLGQRVWNNVKSGVAK
jgi:hypothetical protein